MGLTSVRSTLGSSATVNVLMQDAEYLLYSTADVAIFAASVDEIGYVTAGIIKSFSVVGQMRRH